MIHSWCLCYAYLPLKQAKLELSTFSGEGIHPTVPYWSDMNHSCLFSLLTQRVSMDKSMLETSGVEGEKFHFCLRPLVSVRLGLQF